jgi:hypothetical protein
MAAFLLTMGVQGVQAVVIDFEDVPAGTYVGTTDGPLVLDGFVFSWIGYGDYQQVVDLGGNNVVVNPDLYNWLGAEDWILTENGSLFYFNSLEYGNLLPGPYPFDHIYVYAYGQDGTLLQQLQLAPTTSGLTLTAADLGVEGVPLSSLRINLVSTLSDGDFYYDNIDVTPLPTPADIDIKPGSHPNPINNDGKGVIPVAIFGSPDLDVMFILPWTVELEGMPVKTVGKTDKLLAHYEDVNGDGFDDLVVQIQDMEETFADDATEAFLTGELIDGTLIEGVDEITIVP